jgi:DNA-binding response OmpR family regulator
MKILVVEKDPALRDSIKTCIEDWGHEAQDCSRGKDAVRMFKIGAHDLVILDLMLPDMRGEQLISRLKEIYSEARIVAMTENNSRDLEARIRERGILYYMVKPFEGDNLRSLLDHLARKHSKAPPWAAWRQSLFRE